MVQNASKAKLISAMSLHMNNEFQKAHDLYVEILRLDQNDAQAWHVYGILLMQNGHLEAGKNAIERAIGLLGRYPDAYANLELLGGARSFISKWQADIDHSQRNVEWTPYTGNKTTDRWRHLRMVDFAGCFSSEDEHWLTIGDASGYDSLMLKESGISHVVASSLDTSRLKLAHAAGEIQEYLEINAEVISLPDDSFDYVLCKEALHHMPRPMLAIYEMLRVARKGVIFTEPQDTYIDWPAKKDSTFWRHIEGEDITYGRYDNDMKFPSARLDWYEDGPFNYVYTLSKREVRKMCLGMGLPGYAIKCFNDFYNKEWAEQPAEPESEGFKNTLQQIQLWDALCKESGRPFTYLTGILFKQPPIPILQEKLRSKGYDIILTPTRYLPLKWPKMQ